MEKVNTKSNAADVFTKHVPGEVVWRHLGAIGFEDRGGRAEAAVELVEAAAGGDQGGEDDSAKGGALGGSIPTMTGSIRQVAPIRKGAPRGLAEPAPQDRPQVPAGVGHHSNLDTASKDVMGRQKKRIVR